MEIGSRYTLGIPHGLPQAISPSERAPQKTELIEAVKAINRAELFGFDNELTFVMDPDTHRPIMRIINRDTREVVRQLPSEYVLRLARDLKKKA